MYSDIDPYDDVMTAGDAPTQILFKACVRKARKSHCCDRCKREIVKGAEYDYAAGLDDGEFFESKVCLPCVYGPGPGQYPY